MLVRLKRSFMDKNGVFYDSKQDLGFVEVPDDVALPSDAEIIKGKPQESVACPSCNKKFIAENNRVYCSDECKKAAEQKRRAEKKVITGKDFSKM